MMFAVGHCKTVEFTFDMREDTAKTIADEMMEDLSLSKDEAEIIAEKIKEEIGRMSSEYVESLNLGDADCSPHHHGHTGAPGGHDLDIYQRETVVAHAAAAAVAAVAAAAAAANSSTPDSGSISQQHGTASQSKSGSLTPLGSRPPSYADLVKAMREYHEQQLAEQQRGAGKDGGATPVGALEQPPLEVLLPNGHSLDPCMLAKVAATAASAAAQQLQEGGGPRNGHVFHITSCTSPDADVDGCHKMGTHQVHSAGDQHAS